MAGAGIASAQVHGSSDRQGAHPNTGRMEPQNLTATIFHLLGINPGSTFTDPGGRPLLVTQGSPIAPILGDAPITQARREPGGSLAMVPIYNEDLLLDTDFSRPSVQLQPTRPGRRLQGWQTALPGVLSVWLEGGHARIGIRPTDSPRSTPAASTPAPTFLAQELRNPRAGRFTFSAWVDGHAASSEDWDAFLEQFRCRLVIFGYTSLSKDPTPGKIREFASASFRPRFSESSQSAGANTIQTPSRVSARLRSQDDNANELGNGVGVAIVVEPITNVSKFRPVEASLRIARVELTFDARPRNDDVVV
jgi:hypothetical protein